MLGLMEHQINSMDWLRDNNWCGLLFADIGTGKTISALEAIKQQGFQKTLIIVPAGKKEDWRTECETFLKIIPTVIQGDKEERKLLWLSCASLVVICNYEQVLHDYTLISNNKWHTIIIDECQKIKSPIAKSTKAIKKLHAVSRIALSGTPAPNDLWEMWSISDWIKPGILGRNFYSFKSEWCKTHPVFPSKIVGYRDRNKLLSIFKTIYLRIREEDTDLNLPPLIETIIYVDLTEEERKRYNKLRDDLIIEIEGEENVSVQNLVTKIMRLRQLLDYPRALGLSDKSSKELALETWCAERSSRYLIFTQWSTKAEDISRGLSLPLICGSTPQNERVRILQEFVELRGVGLVATSALEEGFNCQWSDSIVHYSLPWNWARYCQRNGRSRRKGRTEPVESVVFLVRNSVDEWLWKMLNTKKKLQDSLSVQDYKNLLR